MFKLTHTNGSWAYTSLHDFDGPDGRWPLSKVVIDAQGHLYGTTTFGGLQNPVAFSESAVWCGRSRHELSVSNAVRMTISSIASLRFSR